MVDVVINIIGQDGLPTMPTKTDNIRWFSTVLVPCRGSVAKPQVMDVTTLIVVQEVHVPFIIRHVVVAIVDDQLPVLIIGSHDGHVLVVHQQILT